MEEFYKGFVQRARDLVELHEETAARARQAVPCQEQTAGIRRRAPPCRPPERRYQHRCSPHPARHDQWQQHRSNATPATAQDRCPSKSRSPAARSIRVAARNAAARAGSPARVSTSGASVRSHTTLHCATDVSRKRGQDRSGSPTENSCWAERGRLIKRRSAAKPASRPDAYAAPPPLALYSSLTPPMPREGALPQREADAGFSEAEVVCRKGTYRAIPAPDCTNGLASELTHS